MRPIKLTIKGLHSFREKQIVDFESLCEGGVFGIFGPTGSGKSSLLDAMTLALYGKVERAANNTNGILNHAEETLSVSFSFQLGHGERLKRYEVERSFKRSGDTTIKTATARFIDVTSSPVVLAEKAGDVTKEVENLLGLSIDDFTRAVVLPQGKFSEFLSLKGAERRQMLQRLFHLEKYGDELLKKLKSRLMKTKHEKELIEKEQHGLGSASPEDIEQVEKQLVELSDRLTKAKQEQISFEKKFEHVKAIRVWQLEKENAKKRLDELHSKSEQMQETESKITEAIEALRLLPFVQEIEESTRAVSILTQEADKLFIQLKEAGEITTSLEKNFELLKQRKEKDESPLRIKMEELKKVKKEQQDLISEEESISVLVQKKLAIEIEIEKAEEAKERALTEKTKYENAQTELKNKLQTMLVPSEIRKEVYEAVKEKRTVLTLASKYDELLSQQTNILQKKKKAEDVVNQKLSVLERQQVVLKDRVDQLFHWYDRLAEEERELASFSRVLIDKKEAMEKYQQQSLANELRKQLVDGEPCPVCGSSDHPTIAHNEEYVEDNAQLSWILEVLNEVQVMERELEKAKWVLNDSSSKLRDFISTEEVASTVVEESTILPKIFNEKNTTLDDFWRNRTMKSKSEIDAIHQITKQITSDLELFYSLKEEWKENTLVLQGISERYDEWNNVFQECKSQLDTSKVEWKEKFPEYSLDNIDEIWNEIQYKEEQVTVLRERVEKSVPYIEKKQIEAEDCTKVIHNLSLQRSSIDSEIQLRSREMIMRKEKIIETLGRDNNLDQLFQKITADLEKLLNDYKLAEKNYQQSYKELQELDRKYTISNESLRHARERENRAKVQWETQLSTTPFKTMEQVKQASMMEGKIKELETLVNQYKEEKKEVHLQYEKCEKELGGESITEEEYQEMISGLQSLKDLVEELGTERGGLLNVLNDLNKKVLRYQELEEERKKLEELYGQLSKLDLVFRGKAFVEYIAEEQLIQVSRLASDRLHTLTRGRYAIEVDSTGGFIIRDDANGGVKRPVSTLSGGETFLTSLALALSLSASIQLKGEHPLEFFFLDEGFGTLDQELLETVISALEKLHTDSLSVGIISHVPELRERLPRKLLVTPAEPGGNGSKVKIEVM